MQKVGITERGDHNHVWKYFPCFVYSATFYPLPSSGNYTGGPEKS
jgi:hypothetical protein